MRERIALPTQRCPRLYGDSGVINHSRAYVDTFRAFVNFIRRTCAPERDVTFKKLRALKSHRLIFFQRGADLRELRDTRSRNGIVRARLTSVLCR